MAIEVTVRPVPKNKPGFLLRQKRVMGIWKRIGENDPTAIDDLVKYMTTEMQISAPEGTDLTDFILNLSEDDYTALFSKDALDPTNAA